MTAARRSVRSTAFIVVVAGVSVASVHGQAASRRRALRSASIRARSGRIGEARTSVSVVVRAGSLNTETSAVVEPTVPPPFDTRTQYFVGVESGGVVKLPAVA